MSKDVYRCIGHGSIHVLYLDIIYYLYNILVARHMGNHRHIVNILIIELYKKLCENDLF